MSVAVNPLPPIQRGEQRAFLLCRCGFPGWYDYRPYSISTPIISLPCGHDHAEAKRISEDEFTAAAAIYQAPRCAFCNSQLLHETDEDHANGFHRECSDRHRAEMAEAGEL